MNWQGVIYFIAWVGVFAGAAFVVLLIISAFRPQFSSKVWRIWWPTEMKRRQAILHLFFGTAAFVGIELFIASRNYFAIQCWGLRNTVEYLGYSSWAIIVGQFMFSGIGHLILYPRKKKMKVSVEDWDMVAKKIMALQFPLEEMKMHLFLKDTEGALRIRDAISTDITDITYLLIKIRRENNAI